MTKRNRIPTPPPTTTLTLHLGEQSRQHLDRCQNLLADTDPHGRPLSLGSIVRLALRRLLLGLLGERAKWDESNCPIAAEYLAVRAQQLAEEFRAREQEANHE